VIQSDFIQEILYKKSRMMKKLHLHIVYESVLDMCHIIILEIYGALITKWT